MAITTNTFSLSPGWARTDIILQLEEAFSWIQFHGAPVTGLAQTISTYSGGGTVGVINSDYEDVRPVSSSGSGTGASFFVDRNGGNIYRVHVNRPGYGYTDGEQVVLSSEDIGGSINGADSLVINIGIATGVSYGSTTTFYDKDVTSASNYPWGVLRKTVQAGKTYGDTYWGFQPSSDTNLLVKCGSGFYPGDSTWSIGNGPAYANRFAGESRKDIPTDIFSTVNAYDVNSVTTDYNTDSFTIASNNSYQLDLNVFRSSIDPNFVVFSYRHPTLSSTEIKDNTYGTFFLHNYTSSIWDYDEYFLGGMTRIVPEGSTSAGHQRIVFRSEISGTTRPSSGQDPLVCKRSAESGYLTNLSSAETSRDATYYSNIVEETTSSREYPSFYYRDGDRLGSYNAIIKGIPINYTLVPTPYYLPDDFVLLDFEYSTPSANIQQGDTVTVSASEVYTVITGSYRQDTTTRGILFCARTT